MYLLDVFLTEHHELTIY